MIIIRASGSHWSVFSEHLGFEVFLYPIFCLITLVFIFTLGRTLTRVAIRKRNPLAWITPWLLLMQLIQPLSWRWASLFLVGAPLACLPEHRRKMTRREKVLIPLTFILYLFQQNPVLKLFGMRHWTELHGTGLITLYWLSFLYIITRTYQHDLKTTLSLKRKAGRRDETYERRDKKHSREQNAKDRRKSRRRI